MASPRSTECATPRWGTRTDAELLLPGTGHVRTGARGRRGRRVRGRGAARAVADAPDARADRAAFDERERGGRDGNLAARDRDGSGAPPVLERADAAPGPPRLRRPVRAPPRD